MLALEARWRPTYRPLMAEPEHDPTTRTRVSAMAATIKELRESLPGKPSQKTLGAKVGWSGQTWGNYENGYRAIILSLDVQEKIAAALGITHDELLSKYRKRLGHPVSVHAENRPDNRMPAFRGIDDGARRAVFPLEAGDAVLTYPEDISQEGKDQLAEYLLLFTRSLRRPSA